nr:MAG TPA: hypothetical protein [Caudoviricetes sp.]
MWLTSFSIFYETNNNYWSEWCRKGHCGSDAV